VEIPPVLTRTLLTAIETDSLVLLCGAGLSIPEPSNLLSAVHVSRICYDAWQPIEALPAEFRDDVNKLAGHFYARGDFEKVFIHCLVPWNELVGQPNSGHAAVADFLITRAMHGVLSANFDPMIETWAQERKVALQGALNGQEAVTFSTLTSPLIKFHGCFHRGKSQTLWTQGQLNEAIVQASIKSCSEWIDLHLPGCDLLVIGFWTDWGYLNDVLAQAFLVNSARSVTVVDPSSDADLQAKAPDLWHKLTSLSNKFEHVQASGADALEHLRHAYSKAWARKFYAIGRPLIGTDSGTAPPAADTDSLDCNQLYDFRRDAEGVPYNRAAQLKEPAQNAAQSAYTRLLLLNAGATNEGAWLRHSGRTVRVVNGAGEGISTVQARYNEPTTLPQSDIIVCAGAANLGVPARLIPGGRGASIIHPAPGGGASWLTLEEARRELAL
jgi:hypothetical protein